MSDNHNGGEAQDILCPQIVLLMDPRTMQVSIGGTPIAISLAQMIVGEAMRLLEEQRRMAMAQQLGQQIKEQARTQAILSRVAGRPAG